MDGVSFVDPQVFGQAFRRLTGHAGHAINRAVTKSDLSFWVACDQRNPVYAGYPRDIPGGGIVKKRPSTQSTITPSLPEALLSRFHQPSSPSMRVTGARLRMELEHGNGCIPPRSEEHTSELQ